MEYQLTQHAQDAMAKRRIPREWVERVLSSPEWTESDSTDADLEHRLAAIAEFEGRILRVIVKVTVDPPLIITVYFDRRRKRP